MSILLALVPHSLHNPSARPQIGPEVSNARAAAVANLPLRHVFACFGLRGWFQTLGNRCGIHLDGFSTLGDTLRGMFANETQTAYLRLERRDIGTVEIPGTLNLRTVTREVSLLLQ